jgi:hypothetical protein
VSVCCEPGVKDVVAMGARARFEGAWCVCSVDSSLPFWPCFAFLLDA